VAGDGGWRRQRRVGEGGRQEEVEEQTKQQTRKNWMLDHNVKGFDSVFLTVETVFMTDEGTFYVPHHMDHHIRRSVLVFYVREERNLARIGSWVFLTYEAYIGFFTYHGFVTIMTSSRIISTR
jgi:hypothetical protein